ncbi:MAG: enoyl-CoA hydratase [Betaproteobacteria bacterium]|nr:enoyl-CoA hydratase [Betaproteobacteria bacterium]
MNKPNCFSLSTDNHVAHLVLKRPEAMNTMHPTFWRELHEILTSLHTQGTARALVVSSTGKHFSAGMDLQTFGGAIAMDDQSAEGRAAIFDLLTDMQHTFTLFEQLRMPVIFAIQGGCIGGAVDMVTAGCLRYCTSDAFFCVQEINIGMVADVGTLQRLPKLLPMALVKELAYTGRRLGAERALAHGLVNAVLPTHEACVAEALLAAREIASKPPVAIWGTKQVLHYARDHSTEDSLRQMGWMQGAVWSNANVREAITAMKEQRTPQFAPLAPLKGFREFG